MDVWTVDDVLEEEEASQGEDLQGRPCWSMVGRPEEVGWAHFCFDAELNFLSLAMLAQGRVS